MEKPSPIADRVRASGRSVHISEEPVQTLINGIAEFLPPLFTASPGYIINEVGKTSEHFACVVHSPRTGTSTTNAIPADNVCAVIDLIDVVGLEELRAAHARALVVKRLEKSPIPIVSGQPVATTIMTILFARRRKESVETLATEFIRLNELSSDHADWIDMLAISDEAVVSYGCQMAGQDTLGGILPPSRTALDNYSPPIYIIPTLQATKEGTFNKVLALIVSYTVFFSPGTRPVNFNDILVGVCKSAMTMGGYQYNVAGKIAPVPPQHYSGRFLPPRPFLVEASGSKELLASLIYMPWQDGGVILSKGKLPLEGLMIFLGQIILKKGGLIRTSSDSQASYVLPIKLADFEAMMDRLRLQSNMIVRRDDPKFVMEKMADEGTSTPFMARIFLGLLELRNTAYPDARERFDLDKVINQALTPLLSARVSAKAIREGWVDHMAKISRGEQVRLNGSSIHVEDGFYRTLRKEVDSFLYDAAKALKEGGQKVGRFTGQDIGFMFSKEGNYQKGLEILKLSNPVVAAYVQETRNKWSEELIGARNKLDHEGWVLPRIRYEIQDGRVLASQPEVCGMPVVEFVEHMLDRISCFTEEFFAHCFQSRLPVGIDLTVLPLPERPRENPQRFRLTLREGGRPLWQLTYSALKFEER